MEARSQAPEDKVTDAPRLRRERDSQKSFARRNDEARGIERGLGTRPKVRSRWMVRISKRLRHEAKR